MSRITLLLLLGVIAVGCKSGVEPISPPPPPPPPPNHAPVAVIGGPYTSETGDVLFDGSQSSDSDGDALTFAWTFGDGASGTGSTVTHTYAADGNYNVSLVVTDTKHASSAAATTTADVALAAVMVGAGNIATCTMFNDDKTAQIIDTIPGTVFTLGDNAFERGTDSNYVQCYSPSWGRHLSRTRPTLGNHDYMDPSGNAKGSFDYFGNRFLGTPGLGYYSYDVGAWHIIVLNDKGGTDASNPGIDAAQAAWLQADLTAHTNKCTLAMWHVPLFISSNTPGWTVNPEHKPIWDILYANGVDVVLNGQQHNYERFTPMNPSGSVDSTNGIRQFDVGTGGESVDNFTVAIHPHSEIRSATFGVLKLTLKRTSYDWQFIPIAGATFTDSGSGSCH